MWRVIISLDLRCICYRSSSCMGHAWHVFHATTHNSSLQNIYCTRFLSFLFGVFGVLAFRVWVGEYYNIWYHTIELLLMALLSSVEYQTGMIPRIPLGFAADDSSMPLAAVCSRISQPPAQVQVQETCTCLVVLPYLTNELDLSSSAHIHVLYEWNMKYRQTGRICTSTLLRLWHTGCFADTSFAGRHVSICMLPHALRAGLCGMHTRINFGVLYTIHNTVLVRVHSLQTLVRVL